MSEPRLRGLTPTRTEHLTGWRAWLHVINFPEGWVAVTFALFGVGLLAVQIALTLRLWLT